MRTALGIERVDVSRVSAGDVFDRPLVDERGRVLLRADEPVSEAMLAWINGTSTPIFAPQTTDQPPSEPTVPAESVDAEPSAADDAELLAQADRELRRTEWYARRHLLRAHAALRRLGDEVVAERTPRWSRVSRRVSALRSARAAREWQSMLESAAEWGDGDAEAAWAAGRAVARRVLTRLSAGERVDGSALVTIIDDWAQAAQRSPRRLAAQAITRARTLDSASDWLSQRATRACAVGVLTTAAAVRLGWSDHDTLGAGLAGVMADAGMLLVVPEVSDVARGLSDEEFNAMRRHPATSVAMVENLTLSGPLARVREVVAMSVYQHHERDDRSGYPLGLGGEGIHDIARLVAASDVLVGLIAPRADRPPVEPALAMAELVRLGHGGTLSAWACAAMVDLLGAFPPGACLRLNTGHAVEVVESRDAPAATRPVVRFIHQDPQRDGDDEEPSLLDLAEIDPRVLHVVGSLAA
jgi:HD-GYP domain-containing protein (c-di-GMP phosphodiesterase class II)